MFNFIFLKKNNIFFYNYFLIKNYYHIFLYFNYDYNNSVDFLEYKDCKSYFFLKKNSYDIKNKLCVNFVRNNKIINLKFSSYFNYFLKKTYTIKNINRNSIDTGYNYQSLKQINFNKNFINFFSNYTIKKNNFLLLDSDYSHIFPLYKFIYGSSTLYFQKNFFFLKPVYFTRKSWSYFFIKFCQENNIRLLFIVDHDFYIKFYKNIIEFDCSVAALVPFTYCDYFIDYPVYSPIVNPLIKLIYTSYINHIYFQSYNYTNYVQKYNYINQFFKFINYIKLY